MLIISKRVLNEWFFYKHTRADCINLIKQKCINFDIIINVHISKFELFRQMINDSEHLKDIFGQEKLTFFPNKHTYNWFTFPLVIHDIFI